MNHEQSDQLYKAFIGAIERSLHNELGPLKKRVAALEALERERDSDVSTQLAEQFRRALGEAIRRG